MRDRINSCAQRKNGGLRLKKRQRGIPEDERRAAERANKVINAMQLPPGALFGTAHFEINGNREVIVDGCKGVLEYDETKVRINTGKMVTSFLGRRLTIKCLTSDSLIVEGFITSIEFIT